jgi:hypothetical protein
VNILIVTYGAGHVAMAIPVARLAADNGHKVTVLALTTAQRASFAAGVSTIGYADLLAFSSPAARQHGLSLCLDASDSDPVPRAESIAYHGINFAELVEDLGLDGAQAEYEAKGRHAFLPIRFMKRVLTSLEPDVVVATNSPRSERAAILAARALGIPAVCLVDLFALQEVQWIGQPQYADRVCVLNSAVRDFLIAHGRQPDEIVVTGNPAFDGLASADACASGRALRSARGWDDGLINILWASQVEPERHPFDARVGDPKLPRMIEATLRQVVSAETALRLVVRYHPSEQVVFEPAERVELSPGGEPLSAVLHAVDLVVVTASTVGLEAHISGRSVISVDLSIFTPDAPYSEMGISKGVQSIDALAKEIKKWAGEFTHSGLSAPPSSPDQVSATRKILEVIERLERDRRSNK